MTNTKLLRQKIKDSGLRMGYIVEKLDTSYGWLDKKIEGTVPFKAWEIHVLCEILGITDLQEKEDIFFAIDVGI